MKRLIMICMMFISGLVQAEDGAVTSTEPAAIQSSSDASSKDSEGSSVAIANVHQIDLDNTEVDGGGNWLNKRIWYERAQTIFDEIRVMVNAIGDLRIQFSNEDNAVGQKIVSFLETVDFTKGQLDDKFKEILVALDTEQKIVGDLSEEERHLQTTIKQELGTITQIGKDIKSIGEVDTKIEQTIMQAFKTIDECRDYETKSWDTFKSIGKELDDKKARNLYYQMNNYKQNIDQKSSYLKLTLLPYLHNVLVAKVENNITKINEAIEQLKTKGIDLEKIMSKTQEDDATQIRTREKAAAEIAVKKALEVEQAKSKEAAEKAAKALEEEKKKSFPSVMNHYYEATIGKIVNFVYQGYLALTIDFIGTHFKSYNYPVATSVYNGIAAVKAYMHTLVEDIMIHFGGKPVVKAVAVEKIAEKIEDKTDVTSVATTTPLVSTELVSTEVVEVNSEKSASDKSTEDVPSTPLENSTEIAPTPSEDATTPVAELSVVEATTVESPEATSDSDKDVVIQSMKNDDNKQSNVHSFYHVFKTILDLIGTVLMSVYNCITQFFKLLMSFSAYIMS